MIAMECQNEIVVIKSLSRWITHHYNTCPVFAESSIKDAFELAFGPSMVKKVCFYYFFKVCKTLRCVIF
jgi:hypothetical protein